jgi:hypothetical protein
MTATNPIKGTDNLYDENVTPRNSPAFDWIKPIGMAFLKKVLSGIGAFIDNQTEWVSRYIPKPQTEQSGYKPQANPLAQGYRTAARAVPVPVYASKGINHINPGYKGRHLW